MRLSIRAQALLLSAVPLAVLLFVFGLASLRAREAVDTSYWGRHAQAVLGESAALQASAGDANAIIAQHARSQSPGDRARLDAALRNMQTHVSNLKPLVADNPQQEARADHLADLITRFIPIFQIAFNAANDPHQQRLIVQSKAVQNSEGDYNRTLREFESTERQLSIERFAMFSAQSQVFSKRLLITLSAGIIITGLALYFFGGGIVKRLLRLSQNVDRLAAGEDPIPVRGSDEIAQLDKQFRETTKRMRQEQAISSQLQRALLPQQLPRIAGIRIDASYRPAASGTEIGGDWYDVFVLGDNSIGISMGDVTGHGLLAASTMALVRQAIQTAARYTHDAAAVLDLVNRNIVDEGGAVVSAFFCIINTHEGTMQYAVAGHPSPITVRASGTVGMLAGSGLLLGVERNSRYERFETSLESGSALVLYTDGLVETYRGDYSRGVSRLIDAITSEYYNTSENIAEAIQNRVLTNVAAHDDSAIVFIGVTELGASGATLTRTWDIDATAVSEARRLKRALLWHLGEYAAFEEDLTPVELILGELLGNVARHTHGRATVTLEIERDRATLHVSDGGAPIAGVPTEFEPLAESGRGLFLVNALARTLRIERHPTGNHIAAELPVTLERSPALAESRAQRAFH